MLKNVAPKVMEYNGNTSHLNIWKTIRLVTFPSLTTGLYLLESKYITKLKLTFLFFLTMANVHLGNIHNLRNNDCTETRLILKLV